MEEHVDAAHAGRERSAPARSTDQPSVERASRTGQVHGEPETARLVVGSVDDPLEREADIVADRVVRSLAPPDVLPAAVDPGRSRLRRSPLGSAGSIGANGGAVDTGTGADIERIRRSGRPLDPGVRAPMEAALGVGLGTVKVHTGDLADRVSRSLGAEAFTVGHDVVFSNGSYDPGSVDGQRVLAHELAHVVQHERTIRRFDGFRRGRNAGNPGRSENGERKIVGAARRT